MFIRFGNRLLRRTVKIPVGTDCAPLVADYLERDFSIPLSVDTQGNIIEAFNTTQISGRLF